MKLRGIRSMKTIIDKEVMGFMTLIRNTKLPTKHAGVIFNERILLKRNISVAEAATSLNMSCDEVILFVEGKRPVDIPLAKKLETATFISARFWLNIQREYDLHISRNEK